MVERGRGSEMWGVAVRAAALVGVAALGCDEQAAAPGSEPEKLGAPWGGGGDDDELIGLAIDIKDGTPAPLRLHAGTRFFLEQVDISTVVTSLVDEGVDGLERSGDFRHALWFGNHFVEQETAQLPDADGNFTRSRFYQGALWMTLPSVVLLTQLNGNGHPIAAPISMSVGGDDKRRPNDHFFVRRLRAIQRTLGCATATDCSGATHYEEEAVVELRNALKQTPSFKLHPNAAALELRWTANPLQRWVIPVEQETDPEYAYGFQIDVDVLTPPGPDGWYLPGQELTFRVTLSDGEGTPLHPEGSLPSYNDVIFGADETGLQYYQGFFDPTWVYWRRKHRERTFIAHFMGPAQNVQPIHSIVPLDQILTEDVQKVATIEQDGVFDVWKVFPSTDGVFGGAFDPQHLGWAEPGSDTFSVTLPEDAPPGTYRLTTKARRVYHGEDIAFTRTIEVQVGTATPTSKTLETGNCQTCHSEGGSLAAVLHRNPNRGTCYGCHAPLGVEYDAPIHSRVHFIHSRSNRFDANVKKCDTCHLTAASIQRTSKSACLSCHTSYPQSHVDAFGPVSSIYVGGQAESFTQCTSACHTTHPSSGL